VVLRGGGEKDRVVWVRSVVSRVWRRGEVDVDDVELVIRNLSAGTPASGRNAVPSLLLLLLLEDVSFSTLALEWMAVSSIDFASSTLNDDWDIRRLACCACSINAEGEDNDADLADCGVVDDDADDDDVDDDELLSFLSVFFFVVDS